MTLPNFFIVGAPKAGTDELYYDLDQHPDIYMSPLKEPCYFSSEIRVDNFHPSLRGQMTDAAANTRTYLDDGAQGRRFGGIVSELRDYDLLFSGRRNEKAIGEGSVCYLWSATAAAAIARAVPRARIIMVLMDPAERAFQQYLKSVADGAVGHSFQKHLDLALQHSAELSLYHPFLAFGNYYEQVRRYLQHFPATQLSISLYEDLCADHSGWFARVLTFLGVDNSFVPQKVDIPSKPRIPRFVRASHMLGLRRVRKVVGRVVPARFKSLAKRAMATGDLPKLLPEDRATLVNYYRGDITRLQELLKRDLSAWLR